MFKALRKLKSSYGYNRLAHKSFSTDALLEPGFTRMESTPVRMIGIPIKSAPEAGYPPLKSKKKSSKKNKSHPLFSIFNSRRKKMSAKPELVRYMDYLKEGGKWEKDTNAPVIYYTK